MVFLKESFEEVDFEKIQQTTKSPDNLPRMQRVNLITNCVYLGSSQDYKGWRNKSSRDFYCVNQDYSSL